MQIKPILRVFGHLFLALGVGIFIFTYAPIFYSEIRFILESKKDVEQIVFSDNTEEPDFENISPVKPVDENFSIIISAINVNAPIVEDVSMINKNEYTNALRYGVAHAKDTALPGEKGNTFLFAHSSLNFWQLGPFATVFNLLRETRQGDVVTMYYKGKPYEYKITKKYIVNGWNTEPFDVEYDKPTLTLVTCDPPGSTVNRLVVIAEEL